MPDPGDYPVPSDVGGPPRSRHRLRWSLGGILLCLIAIGLFLGVRAMLKPKPAAVAGDVPVHLTGLGTVEAYNTVTIHVRINGTLDKVVFVEGQDVKTGDLLAQIDPRPYQAQLDQVVATKAHDEAPQADARLDSLATTPYLIAAALLVVYLILGVFYESFIHPLTILSTLPSAGAGALLMLFGYDLSVIAIIGIIMLIGIVKKNGIMMVDFALSAQRERGIPPEEAIYQACVPRFRPIMITTMCAILGGLPLMLAGGTGSELRQPLGFAMVGGLLLSQALTLFTTPVVYLYLDRLGRWGKPREAAPGTPAVGT